MEPGVVESYYDLQKLPDDLSGRKCIELDGESLTPDDLIKIGLGQLQVKLSDGAVEEVKKAREIVERMAQGKELVYGVNTGVGRLKRKRLEKDEISEFQVNLIHSHCAGVGPPLSAMRTRMMLALRINVLAKGPSGCKLETIQKLIAALNASCLSYVPEKGSVGASGDLAPLSHLALGMMGEGKMWSPKSGWADAQDVLTFHGLTKIELGPKEGLALINGTQLITALGIEALHRAEIIAKQADVVAALSIDVLEGTPVAFDADIHKLRPHHGQQEVAKRVQQALLCGKSEIREGVKEEVIQDAYSMRCVPQVHGVVHDTLTFVKGILTTEMNSATDNPMVLTGRNQTISCGNFHGEYPAKALDFLAIAIHEIASMSERRLERLINPDYNPEGFDDFLVKKPGLNSGFMLAHVTAAALVSENKVLTHPASVDTIPTSAGSEDHVSMGSHAARKALAVVENVEHVVAIELLAACQGLDYHKEKNKKTTPALEEVYKLVRTEVSYLDKDRFMASDMQTVTRMLQGGEILKVVEPYGIH